MSNREDDSDGVVSLLAGVGVGVIIGAAVALLLAPQAGSQTRAQIRETADETLGRLKESMDDLKGKVEDLTHQTKEALQARRSGQPNPAQGDVAGATDDAAA